METQKENTEEPVAGEKVSSKKSKSKETILGIVLFLGMIVFVLASLGLLGWGAYAFWQKQQQEKEEPSILSLEIEPEETKSAEETKPAEAPKAEETSSDEGLVSAKSATISVLNGGATKGTAGVAADFLKGKGFTKVTPGNTLGNFTGAVVYFDTKSEKEATALSEVLSEKYPTITTKPAITTNKETTVAPLTVIFGK
ncbi:MAG: LytR C-terminal domain-containing protein [Patescibacteria group bacterium]